jgi:hypothetical protein
MSIGNGPVPSGVYMRKGIAPPGPGIVVFSTCATVSGAPWNLTDRLFSTNLSEEGTTAQLAVEIITREPMM